MRPIAGDRENSVFTSRLHLGKRLAVVARLMQSAYMNGYDAYAYRRDLMPHPPPLHRADQIGELLPLRWLLTLKRPLKPLRATVKLGYPRAYSQ